VLGTHYDDGRYYIDADHHPLTPPTGDDDSRPDGFIERRGMVEQWIELWDYVGGARFRGFVAEHEGERALFVFFDEGAVANDLKPGVTALLELCGVPEIDCTRLVACLDRNTDAENLKGLTKDLGWVGFEAMTLADWTDGKILLSDRWLFLGMDV